jgi:hypothetical protein
MPQAIAAVQVYVSSIAVGLGASAATGAAIASAFTSAVVVGGLSAIGGKLFGPKLPDFASESAGRTQILRSPIAPRRTIYGTAKVSGPLLFATTSGGRNGMLHLLIGLAAHECEEIGDVYFADKLNTEYDQTDPDQVRINKHLGAADQAADTDLVSEVTEWTSAHRLRGIAYVYVRLWWSAKIFPTGIPNISAIVKGKKLYDPRDGTTVWSENPALCIRDYLVGDHGLACDADEIDETSFIAAANLCDELVTVPDGAGGTVTEARYTCNGVVLADTAPLDALTSLLTSCVGTLTYTEGKYKLTAGSYTLPTWSMDEDDLRADIQVQGAVPRKELYNAIRGIYVEPNDSWAPTDMPPVTNSSYAAADGATIYREIELPYSTSVYTAQRIGKVHLEQSRQRLTITFPAKIAAFRLNAWDTVQLTIARFGWAAKAFRVIEWQFSQDGGVDLILREDEPAIWDWVYTEATEPETQTPISNPDEAEPGPPTGLSVADTTVVSTVGVDVSWTAPVDDPYVITYQIEYKISTDSTYLAAGTTRETALRITGLAPATLYDIRVRSSYNSGAVSTWASTTHTTSDWEVINVGEVRIWSGSIASIPTGWALCDGGGTPARLDLRDRFIVGAGSTYSVGATGGATTDTSSGPSATTTVDNTLAGSTVAVGSNSHTHEVDILPPYYALAYIQYEG